MCCFSCSCAFKLQLVPVLALGLVRAPGYEQHLLLRVLLFLLRAADAIMDVFAPPMLDAVSAILCAACVGSCAFKLQLVPVLALGLVRALMRFHAQVPALPVLNAAAAILCAAFLVPAHLNCSWCRFLLWVWFGLRAMSSICCCFCCCFC